MSFSPATRKFTESIYSGPLLQYSGLSDLLLIRLSDARNNKYLWKRTCNTSQVVLLSRAVAPDIFEKLTLIKVCGCAVRGILEQYDFDIC